MRFLRPRHAPPAALAVASAALALAAPASAQTLVGRVVEDGTDRPVAGALVALVDRAGESRASATSDSLGRFRLSPPRAGEYTVESVRLGYERTRSPLFALEIGGTVAFDLALTPLPVGLEGLEVSVEREADLFLRNFGLTPATLGERWIGREDIEAMPAPSTPADAIRWRSVPGLWVHGSSPFAELCVTFRRAKTVSGADRCAIVVRDGAIIPRDVAMGLHPDEIEAMAILGPIDATTFYGTAGGGGAVLIWTRYGRDSEGRGGR